MNSNNEWVFQYWGWNGSSKSIEYFGKTLTREEAIRQGINHYIGYTDHFYIGKVESRKVTEQEREADSLLNEWCLKAEKDGITPAWTRVVDIEKIDGFTLNVETIKKKIKDEQTPHEDLKLYCQQLIDEIERLKKERFEMDELAVICHLCEFIEEQDLSWKKVTEQIKKKAERI